jgi:lysozyme family protein
MATFELAIPIVLRHEGGYVNDPADPGGETNFGISKRSYPDVDIKNLTQNEAMVIYRTHWWDRYNYGAIIPQAVANKIFDMAVNLGASRAHKIVQKVLQIDQDGIIGPATLAELNTQSSLKVIVGLQDTQAQFYRNLVLADPSKQKFLQGWLNRAYDRS